MFTLCCYIPKSSLQIQLHTISIKLFFSTFFGDSSESKFTYVEGNVPLDFSESELGSNSFLSRAIIKESKASEREELSTFNKILGQNCKKPTL